MPPHPSPRDPDDTSLGSPRHVSQDLDDTSLVATADTSPAAEHDPSTLTAAQHDPSRLSGETRRICQWCRAGLEETKRRDSIYCSKRCRQAAHRFHRGAPRRVAATRSLRFAYADPPYPGQSGLYRDHPDYAGEVDHQALIAAMVEWFPDGWALSTSARALPDVLSVAPADVAVAAWFRGERPTRSYRPLSSWEPVVVFGGRPRLVDSGPGRRLDALVHVARARTTDPARVIGAKPAAFCYWMFDLLGALPGDELFDLFPGSGGITRAWEAFTSGPPVAPGRDRSVAL